MKRQSLENKVHHTSYPISVLFLLALTFLTATLSIFLHLNQQMRTELLRQVEQQQKTILSHQIVRVEELVNHLISDLTNLAQKESIKKGREKQIRFLLSDFYQRHQEVVVAGYFMNKRGILKFVEGRDQGGEGEDISYQAHIKELFRTKRPVVSVSFMAVEGYSSMAIHCPIVINNEVEGSVATLIKWDDLAHWLEKPGVSSDNFLILLDPSGKVVCHPNSQWIGKMVQEAKDTHFEKGLSWKKILHAHSAVAGLVEGGIFEEKKSVFTYQPLTLGNKECSLVSAIPYSSIAGFIANYYTLSKNYLIFSFLLISFILIYAGWIFHSDQQRNLKLQAELKEDIKKRKETEEGLVISNEKKRRFLSHISHEVSTPLSSLQESLSLVLDGSLGEINEQQKKFLAIARQSVKRVFRLVDELLDISRIEAGVIKISPQPLNIAVLARGVVQIMQDSAEKKGLKLSSLIPFHLPLVMVDQDRTIQILTNLIDNSIKYTPEGKIQVLAEEKENFLKVSVVDTGIGILAQEREKIFDEFYQIKQERGDVFPGRGLGLNIIKSIVERQGGKIWVESEFGKGSKFIFTVPIVPSSSFQHLLDEAIRFGREEGKMFTLFLLKVENLKVISTSGDISHISSLWERSLDLEEIRQKEKFMRELELLLKETMRNSIDIVGMEKDKIGMVIWHLLEEKIEFFISRLKKRIKTHKFSHFPLKLSYRIAWARFPEDGGNGKTLLKKIEEKRGITL